LLRICTSLLVLDVHSLVTRTHVLLPQCELLSLVLCCKKYGGGGGGLANGYTYCEFSCKTTPCKTTTVQFFFIILMVDYTSHCCCCCCYQQCIPCSEGGMILVPASHTPHTHLLFTKMHTYILQYSTVQYSTAYYNIILGLL
jgi:hypothetical protein